MKTTPATPPAFDPVNAKPVDLYRHEPTARTVAFHQVDAAGVTHLYSATGGHIAAQSAAKATAKPSA